MKNLCKSDRSNCKHRKTYVKCKCCVKNLGKHVENCGFAPKTTKNIMFFNEKRPQRDPKLCATRQAVMGIHSGTIGLSREEREEEREGAMRN